MPGIGLLLALQGWTWSVTPVHPTVGDTVWLEATVPLSAGWRLRPGRLEPSGDIEPLADPAVFHDGDTWVVRYAVVAWTPGGHQVTLPPAWRLGPDGRADSLPSGVATFAVVAVIPDSVARPAPRPALVPLRRKETTAWPVAVALLGGAAGLSGLVRLRRKRPRNLQLQHKPQVQLEGSDVLWLAAGEPRAVAARAAARLRSAIATAIPEAHLGLATPECLAVVKQQAAGAPVRELAVTLEALELVAFAGVASADVGALSRRAEALARAIQE